MKIKLITDELQKFCSEDISDMEYTYIHHDYLLIFRPKKDIFLIYKEYDNYRVGEVLNFSIDKYFSTNFNEFEIDIDCEINLCYFENRKIIFKNIFLVHTDIRILTDKFDKLKKIS